jgi:hypothetical protein
VESRAGPKEPFGCGNEKKMKFSSFLDSLDDVDETSYYLTTQELSYTHEGQPSLTSPPIDGLIGNIIIIIIIYIYGYIYMHIHMYIYINTYVCVNITTLKCKGMHIPLYS